MTNLEMDGIELILTIISKSISKQVTLMIWYKRKKRFTTPQQFEEDHIQLMTMRYIKVVQTNSNERAFLFNV
jgi:hypothetical protein